MKPLVIYHADCTDEYAAAFAAWLKLGDEAEYLPMQYNTPEQTNYAAFEKATGPLAEREVFMIDFSLKTKEMMDAFFARSKRVVWLDHHKSAFEMWCLDDKHRMWVEHFPHRHITLNNSKSGALLAWEYFHPGTEVPLLIRRIDDRDRWQFKLDGSKELHAALASYRPWSFEQWLTLAGGWEANYKLGVSYCLGLVDEGSAILRAQDAAVSSMAKQARKCAIRLPDPTTYNDTMDLPGLACNSPLHQSELGHVLATQSGTFGLIYYIGADNRVKCSLRSNGGYDVSAIAKAFGGGGHLNAAGMEVSIETLLGWLK